MVAAILEDKDWNFQNLFAEGEKGRYNHGMSNNVFDIEHHRPLEALVKELGGMDECKRLGFVFEDENKVASLSSAGMGYLLFVKAAEVNSLAEAFAAGYLCALENNLET